jgi:methionyl-tRNA formyltransferase
MVVNPALPLKGVALLAAQTARSQAYLQALVASGLYPETVIILGEDGPVQSQEQAQLSNWQGIVLPDLTEPISATCERAGIAVRRSPESDVNSDATIRSIRDAAPEIVIYSGVGGQIVSARALRCGPKFLHMHSGWLPEYRGSTTLYYALLNGELPGVTALFLDATIDTGPVVARRHYPKPPPGLDLDRVYDAAIRADLLVKVMHEYAVNDAIASMEVQNPEEGGTYYVIHPVLKHVAILSLPQE